MQKDTFYYRVLAISAIFQAAHDVHLLASRGHVNQKSLNRFINSLLDLNPTSNSTLLEPSEDFKDGMKVLRIILNGNFSENAKYCLNYGNGMLRLTRMLIKDQERQQAIGEDLVKLEGEVGSVESEISAIYQSHISTLGNRIMVKGQGALLNDIEIANKVRCTLLGGIRYGWLWQQLGGSRWQFILKRRQTVDVLNQWLV